MATTVDVLLPTMYIPTSITTVYTAPTGINERQAIFDKLTVTHAGSGNVSFSAYLVPSGESAADEYLVVNNVSLSAEDTYELIEVERHILNPGDFLAVIADTASALAIRGSGRLISSGLL